MQRLLSAKQLASAQVHKFASEDKKLLRWGAMRWRLLDTGVAEAAWNMAVDEAVLNLFPKLQMPTLRFYSWARPTLSIGHFQSAKEVNPQECKLRGYEFVRRPTGGRAVLHDDELTYSVVCPIEILSESVAKSHEMLSEALALGLKQLGLQAELTKTRRRGSTPACFDAPSWAELTINRKKVIGSAQMRNKHAILQHGSIPLRIDPKKLRAVLRANSDIKQKAAGLYELAGRAFSVDALQEAIKKGFEQRFGIKFQAAPLTQEELALADKLAKGKYANSEWNFKR